MRTYERVWGKPEDDVSLLGRDYGFEDHSDESDYNNIKDVEADLTEDDEIVIFNPLVAGVFDYQTRKVQMLIVANGHLNFNVDTFFDEVIAPYERKRMMELVSDDGPPYDAATQTGMYDGW